MKKIYTTEILEFMKSIAPGKSREDICAAVNSEFRTDFTVEQIKGCMSKNKITSGIDCRFSKGIIPHNKGQKGVSPKGSEKGWFKKGQAPHNQKPVGSERITWDGYTEVKVDNCLRWKKKHVLIWEEANGKVPEGYVVSFLDGDKTNFDIENLQLLSPAELIVMNNKGLFMSNTELTRTGHIVAKLILAKGEAVKRIL